jgi:NADPH:quinone reductase-like Zn-dependent oxidoreductase
MRGAGITAIGGGVELIEFGEREPARDEVVIEVKAAGVGNWDEFVRTGGWEVGTVPPMALGIEAAGIVLAVGAAVTGVRVGSEVMTYPLPLRWQGTWAERLVAPASLTASRPAEASWEAAAAFPVPALTAAQATDAAIGVGDGETLLVNGGGGVTGGMVVQLALLMDATVRTTASERDAARLQGYGATVLHYHDPDWPARVRELAGEAGLGAAVHTVPGGSAAAVQLVRDGGRLATITHDPPAPGREIAIANVNVRPDGEQLASLSTLLGAGALEPRVAATFPLERAAEALAEASSGHAGGALVVVPTPPATGRDPQGLGASS